MIIIVIIKNLRLIKYREGISINIDISSNNKELVSNKNNEYINQNNRQNTKSHYIIAFL